MRKIDEYTVEFTSGSPDAFLPYQVVYILIASPKQWETVGKDWAKFHERPSGTGPFKVDKYRAAAAGRTGPEQGLLGQEAACRRPSGWS